MEPALSKEYLEEHYIRLGENRNIISEQTGVSPIKIGSLLQKYGIRRYSVQRHGAHAHPLNVMWCGMKERCSNKNADNYKWYGAKGITVCDEWTTFVPFFEWALANGWEPGKSIDRIDGTRGYSPDNCRFITHKEQCRNRSSNVYIEVDGIIMLQCEWTEYLGLDSGRLAKWKSKHNEEYVTRRIKELLDKRIKERADRNEPDIS